MKNKTLLFCGSVILFILLIFGSYSWYLYFLRASGSFNINYNSRYLKSSGIIFQDNGNNVYETDAKSLDDESIKDVPSYNFQVTNTINSTGKYTLYIEDLPANLIDDGCTEQTLLSRKQLKYQLSMNNKVIKEDFMESIKDNILDSREIDGNVTNNYSLKIYIHDEALDWFGKHYHYKVTLNK